MTEDSAHLFTPVKIGDLTLPNRIAMAPLTRNRAIQPNTVPSPIAPLYYRQRASAGLLITEASQISQQGQGYAWTPGCFTDEQVEAWKRVTEAVHEDGGHIFLQLWHVGRISHASLQPNGGAPVAPSAITAKTKTFVESGKFVETSEPHALETHEIAAIVADYAHAAACARRAGFDGVELHGANGYLIDQFLRDRTNQRSDAYGGSIDNRLRFALEVVDAVLTVWPATRVGMRIAPVSPANDIADSNPTALFGALIAALSQRNLAYIHVVEGATGGARDVAAFDFVALRRAFSGAYIANNGYTRALAIDAIEQNHADMIAFGRPFISNPDLVERLRINAPLANGDQATYYGGGAKGYTDYPAWTPA
ncbi:MAG: alkene reductase [Pseudomonadota bacterium]|nr:alkene reductase [Pseudomonadota bacterium]